MRRNAATVTPWEYLDRMRATHPLVFAKREALAAELTDRSERVLAEGSASGSNEMEMADEAFVLAALFLAYHGLGHMEIEIDDYED